MGSRARLFAQLGWVCHFDAARLRHEYELDERGLPVIPTAEELEEAKHLEKVADRYFDRAAKLEPDKGWGTDDSFG